MAPPMTYDEITNGMFKTMAHINEQINKIILHENLLHP
jgi:hypothetical protein